MRDVAALGPNSAHSGSFKLLLTTNGLIESNTGDQRFSFNTFLKGQEKSSDVLLELKA